MSDFAALLRTLPTFRLAHAGGLQESPGLRVTEHFAIAQNIQDDDDPLRQTWSLTHLPSGRSAGWAADGEALAWLALHLEEIGGSIWASAEPWEDARYFDQIAAERVRLFGMARRLDPEGGFGW